MSSRQVARQRPRKPNFVSARQTVRIVVVLLSCSGCDALRGDWKDARSEFLESYRSSLRDPVEGFGSFTLKPAVYDELANCLTDESLRVLRSSACRPNDSREEAESCLKAIGFERRVTEATTRCSIRHFPDDWGIYSDILLRQYQEVKPPDAGEAWPECARDRTIELLEASECEPINREAESPAQVPTPMDGCLAGKASERLEAALLECR